MKTSVRSLSLFASFAALVVAAPALAAVYMPIEDAELLRRADTVVVARAAGSTVVAGAHGMPETRTAFEVIDGLSGEVGSHVEVVVPGGELPNGVAVLIDGVPRFTPGARYVLALTARPDGGYVPTELGLGAFDVVRDEAGRVYATRTLFRGERVAVRERGGNGAFVERREPLRELAAFTSYVRGGLYRLEALPGSPAYVVGQPMGALSQVREKGMSALWDDHWCPNGAPGTCGTAFDRYRWVDTTATVRTCDEEPSSNGQRGVPAGGVYDVPNAVDLWTNDAGSDIRYSYAGTTPGTCNPAAIPAAGTVPLYLDDIAMFGGTPIACPFDGGGVIAIGAVVTDQSVHAFKGTTYRTIRAGIGWLRRMDPECGVAPYPSSTFQTVVAHVLGSTLGLTNANLTRNPNDTNPDDDRFALMISKYLTVPSPFLGSDDREGICYLYGSCAGSVEAKLFVPFVGSVDGQNGSRFTSDLALTNRSAVSSNVTVEFIPSLGTGRGSIQEVVNGGEQLLIPDVIERLRTKGLEIPATGDVAGVLRVKFAGVYPYDASATVRTRTDAVSGEAATFGRVGLAYQGLSEEQLLLGPAWILGLRATAQDRSNIAFQHAGIEEDGNIRIRATWFGPAGAVGATPVERTLSPGGWTQFALTDLEPTATQGYVKVELVEGRAPWYAYGVINDNRNSDGAFIAPVTDEQIRTIESVVLPVAVEAGDFTTEIILNNVSTEQKAVALRWVADGLPGSAITVNYTLQPGEQRVIPDWVEALRQTGSYGIPAKGARLAGAIFVTVPAGSLSGTWISARVQSELPTTAPALKAGPNAALEGERGLIGVHFPAASGVCLANQAAGLSGLRQDEQNRTNIAIVNTGAVDDSATTYLVEVFDGGTRAKAGEMLVSNLPSSWFIQLDGALATTAPGVRNAYVRISVATGVNPFIAYAVINDGSEPGKLSGDGAFIPSDILNVSND